MTAWFGTGSRSGRASRSGLARLHRQPAQPGSAGVRAWPAAPRGRPIPDHLLGEVVAALIDAGAPPSTALERVSVELDRLHDPRATAWAVADVLGHGTVLDDGAVLDGGAVLGDGAVLGHGTRTRAAGGAKGRHGDHERFVAGIAEAVALAGRSGLPPGDLIRDCARGARRDRAERSARRLGRLPVLLVLPMGLCLLPAAVLLGVAPVVLGLLAGLDG
jgi:hypothetical protein